MMLPRYLGLGVLSASLLLTACEGNRPRGQGGGTVQPTGDFAGLYVANPDHGTVTRFDTKTGAWSKIQVGLEPTRIARHEGVVYVTNRGERKVTILHDDGKQLSLAGVIATGAEPFGVAATADRVYVSASVSGEVVEYDAASRERLRTWQIDGEPRGIALDPSGNSLIVAQTYGGRYAHIDLESGAITMMDLPEARGFDFETGEEFLFSRRITGDPTFTPDGASVVIPVLYVDNTTEIFDPNDSTDMGAAAPPSDGERPGGGGGSGYQDRMNPGIVVTPVDERGQPVPEEGVPVAVSTFAISEVDGIIQGRAVNAYPVSVSFSRDGIAFVALKGADAVVAIDLDALSGNATRSGDAIEPGFGAPGRGINFQFAPNLAVLAGAGPDGVVVADDKTAFVHALFDNSLEKIDVQAVTDRLRNTNIGNDDPVEPPGGGRSEVEQLRTFDALAIESKILPDAVERGRRLFFTTGNPTMSADGAGVSCATCHFNGRTDGLTWTFGRGLRQTPSLAGNVSLAEPVGWQGDRPTVAEDAMLTSQGLMGGDGMTEQNALDIQAFVNFTRDVDNPFKDADADALHRGKAIFERPDVACASCHNGPALTNNAIVPMFELEKAKVRSLIGVAMTAPYFHDGSAATLRDVLERSRDGSMGNTSSLSDAEMDDLVVYLKSL